ncbi:hypothetical protein ONS95_002899 [Cadophora gregata]|uniref:uncharacterized protein n=1 Tax=Cadophora gregata TaxID=51156 RepID=UPI0026DCEEBB|nr:uncharacterized protein ONS95_002899 [Cadophora gregata]KAK0108078.1 hypothetical protein ONS95_002899 [Cadophora gregata]KAK0109335.1 hypothetical protein ONS96_003154 [Cadophora gregata f. sp. sojae]
MKMQLLTLITLATGTLALPAAGTRALPPTPSPTLTSHQYGTPHQLAAAAALGSGKPSSPAAPGGGASSSGSSNATAAGGACSPQILALAAGIQSNIDDQNNELTTVNALGMVLGQNPLDMTLYGATQSSLMGFVTKGILIRENNQKLAPAGNAALDGLAKVAGAQAEELNLTMSLAIPASGAIDTVAAGETVKTLQKDFAGGIEQNKLNLAAAMSGCTMAAATPDKAPEKASGKFVFVKGSQL